MAGTPEDTQKTWNLSHEIPPFTGYVEKAQTLLSVECGDPLVLLNTLISPDIPIVLNPMYYLQGLSGTSENMYLRSEVASSLIKASKLLLVGYMLVIYDAYRSPETQQALYEREKAVMRIKNPQLEEAELDQFVQQYVSLPSWDKQRPSPHGSGGSVDLSVIKDNGELLDMGTPIDSLDIQSQTAFYINGQTDQKRTYHQNRQLLYSVMIEAGFTNYPGEWWHFDKGNRTYAAIKGKQNAIYGLPDNPCET